MDILRKLLLGAMILLPLAVSAEADSPGFGINLGIGATLFDGSRELDDGGHWSLGGEYRFDNPWALELNFTAVDSESEISGSDADVNYLSLGALYHLPARDNLVPFLSAGVGEIDVDTSGASGDDTVLLLGAGLKYRIDDRSAWRVDLRLYPDSGDLGVIDTSITVGYQHGFGKAPAAPVDGDDDGDGVPDSGDRCPNTPVGDEVDADGCTIVRDGDGDGVPDNIDQCPDTPAGDRVDARGCTEVEDSDGDGVADALDRCPGTPAGDRVNAEGCPDEDGDGVTDSRDKCPRTPPGLKVDEFGCGPDADMDGVPNHRDECPKTFPPALVDELGCYVILEEVVRITLDVEFDFDKATSRPEHEPEVKKVADFMAKYPLTEVVLEGHTDSKGSDAYNQNLSERRANTIATMLIERFKIDPARVSTVGYGESRPIDTNETREGRQRNRRVVAEISAIEQVKRRL